ncbi:MAG: hypothetical protein RLY93_09005 [Sumerlaeia bacterium]
MSLISSLRSLVDRIQEWLLKVERSQGEHAREILNPPPAEGMEHDSLRRDRNGALYLDLDSQGEEPPMPPPAPPKRAAGVSRESRASSPDPLVPLPDRVAGIRTRQRGEAAGNQNGVVQNETNDTIYNQRNELVGLVHEKYAKYGDTIATAILSKVFLPNGLDLLLGKLELTPSGDPFRDHDRVAELIDRHGVEAFCQRAGIKYDAEKVMREQQRYTSSQKQQRVNEYQKNLVQNGVSSKVKLKQTNIKPLTLTDTQEIKKRSIAPAPPTPAPPAKVEAAPNAASAFLDKECDTSSFYRIDPDGNKK